VGGCKMQWRDASELFAMGGYALYVWGSLGACAAGMLLEPLMLAHRRRQALALVRRERLAREDEAQPNAHPNPPVTRPIP
jgi:heme exporter protein D